MATAAAQELNYCTDTGIRRFYRGKCADQGVTDTSKHCVNCANWIPEASRYGNVCAEDGEHKRSTESCDAFDYVGR